MYVWSQLSLPRVHSCATLCPRVLRARLLSTFLHFASSTSFAFIRCRAGWPGFDQGMPLHVQTSNCLNLFLDWVSKQTSTVVLPTVWMFFFCLQRVSAQFIEKWICHTHAQSETERTHLILDKFCSCAILGSSVLGAFVLPPKNPPRTHSFSLSLGPPGVAFMYVCKRFSLALAVCRWHLWKSPDVKTDG